MQYLENSAECKLAKKIAGKQYSHFLECGEYPTNCIDFVFNGQSIISIFVDNCGLSDISLKEAYDLYGEDNVNYFISECNRKYSS